MNSAGKLENRLFSQLNKRKLENRLRELETADHSLIDFWSNDYLGLCRNQDLLLHIKNALFASPDLRIGGSGSRLISGNYARLEELETYLAESMLAGSATFFSSTYLANLALLGSLSTRHDTYVMDASCHASLKEGVRLSHARKLTFHHNDMDDLRRQLKNAAGQAYVITESLFSMEGDLAPLQEIDSVCRDTGAILIVDEAHASGLFGEGGSGLAAAQRITHSDTIRMIGFGKAFGQAGGAVLGPASLKPWVSNFALPFIYSTAPSPVQVETLFQTLLWLEPQWNTLQATFQEKIALLNAKWSIISPATLHSPIQRISCSSVEEAKNLSQLLRANHIGTKAILPPTVPEGQQQLRFTWHSFNTLEELELLVMLVKRDKAS